MAVWTQWVRQPQTRVAAPRAVSDSSVDGPGPRPLHRDAQHHRQRAGVPQRAGSVLRDPAPGIRRQGHAPDDRRSYAPRRRASIRAGTITRVGDRITRRNPTIEIWVERGTEKKERLFNPYTGADLGDSVTQGEYFVLWLARLHDELLFDRPGRYWNGIGSAVLQHQRDHRPRRLVARFEPLEAQPEDQVVAVAGAASTGICTAPSDSGCSSSC